ncbi:MAG: hypothetical protein QOC66_2349 [Pseudonocardiales bacterium]|nr:hypothetical protein [Pseudonocardiales bacterium]
MPNRVAVAAALLIVAVSAPRAGAVGGAVGGRVPQAAAPGPGGEADAVIYTAPVSPLRVVRGFRPPENRYGAGHRGVDLGVDLNTTVRTAGAGVVRFAGPVAGRGVVVVLHADGISTEYEPVTPSVRAGAVVRSGQIIGHVHGTHRGCPAACLHWGARRGGEYLDPLALLRPLGPVVLLPWPRGS